MRVQRFHLWLPSARISDAPDSSARISDAPDSSARISDAPEPKRQSASG